MKFFRVIFNAFHFNRTNWKAVSLCFLAALVFWFFNALNKNYATNLRFGVNFEFDQEKYVPVEPLPESVFMNVSGNGWDLLRKSLGFNLPAMNIALERPTEVKKIVGSTLPALLAGQLGNLQINHVVTDTLYLFLDPREKKKVKVWVDPDQFKFSKGFDRLSPVVILPDSIEIEGPKSIIEKTADSVMLTINEGEISSDYREEVEVVIPDGELIKRNPALVEVIFEVVEWTEISKSIKLDIQNTPAGVRLHLENDSIICKLLVPSTEARDLLLPKEAEMAFIDLTGVRRGETKLLPFITGLPDHAKVLSLDSVAIRLY